jgi:hypothetical protein
MANKELDDMLSFIKTLPQPSVYAGITDSNAERVYVGYTLRSEWGYDVIVYKSDDGEFVGKLVCDIDHACSNIPYHIGNSHTIIKRGDR